MSTSITFRDREVTNPVLRRLVASLGIATALIVVPLGIGWMALQATITLPIHLALRATGRDGFGRLKTDADGALSFDYHVPSWASLTSAAFIALVIVAVVVV